MATNKKKPAPQKPAVKIQEKNTKLNVGFGEAIKHILTAPDKKKE